MSIAIGQLDLLMAAAIVIGFRWPAAWVLPFITKLTPGIGVLWFAARREWRSLGIALGATAAVVGASMAVDPARLAGLDRDAPPIRGPDRGERRLPAGPAVDPPAARRAAHRLGGATDRRWMLPIGMTFALPTVWLNTPTILVAILPLVAAGADTPAARWLRAARGAEVVGLQRLRRRLRRAGLVPRREIATMVAAPASRRSSG